VGKNRKSKERTASNGEIEENRNSFSSFSKSL